MRPVISKKLVDPDAEVVRRSTAEAITELQTLPIAGAIFIPDVVLPDATDVRVSHKLGRAPRFVSESTVREVTAIASAGIIVDLGTEDTAGRPINRANQIVLRASGYGATIVVNVMVVP